jgi:hypothetical protein
MTPATLNLTIRPGLTFGPVEITCKDAAGNPVDLTGWTAWAEVRRSQGESVILDLTPQITDAPAGKITLSKSREDTAGLRITGSKYFWDLILARPNGDRIGPIVAGTVQIVSTITRP